jgi:actin-related protein 3
MFETFNVPALYIGVQAVLALCASLLVKGEGKGSGAVTGTVIDSGDGVTHVIPVYEGFVIGSCIKHIPLAGRDVTNFMIETLRNRGEPLPAADAIRVANRIKEQWCYVCPDILKEFGKYDADMGKHVKTYVGKDKKTKKEFKIDVGYERFLGPEIFFHPEFFDANFTTPLPTLVDTTIQNCPIDTRRALYKYITLSGGTTMFKHFVRRLQRDIGRKTKERYDATKAKYPNIDVTPTEVNVVTHPYQRFAVWFGGSMLASQAEFLAFFHTKAAYEEIGPRICRSNQAMGSLGS